VSYKSIRYPGHNHLLKFLLEDMRLKDDPDALAAMWNSNLPTTYKDQVVIFVTAIGQQSGRLTESVFARTVYHQVIDGENWSGIQITTAAGVCGVVDLLFEGKVPQKGFVRMEDIDYQSFITNRFGRYYA